MQQDAQKQARKFCRAKEDKNGETHPVWAEKGETGCVLGAGEGCSRYGRVGKPEIRTKMHQIAMQHMKKGNRRKPSVFAGFLAGAEGLEPSARGFGVDVGEHGRERGKERCWPILPDKSQKSGAGLVLWGIFQAEIRCQIASLRGSSTTGQDLYSSQGSKSMQAAGSRFPSKSQAKVLLRTVRHSLNTCPTRGTQCRLCGTTQFLV